MKGKVLGALGVLAAAVLVIVSVFLMAFLPEYEPGYLAQRQPPESPPTAATHPAEPASASVSAFSKEPPTVSGPVPTDQELMEIDGRLREAVPRMSLLERAWRWHYSGPDNMPQDEHDKARALYMRYLNSFAGIRTANYRNERFKVLADGSEQLLSVRDVWWEGDSSFRRERVETTDMEDEKPQKRLYTLSGQTCTRWEDHVVVNTQSLWWGNVDYYLQRNLMSALRERRPDFLSSYSHCDVDDGTRGFSRVWSEKGMEVRFDTATGLLTEQRLDETYWKTFTYQNINGTWFPKEIVSRIRREGELVEGRDVFSHVTINEPTDEALFEGDKF